MARNPWESDADVFVPPRGGSRVLRFLLGLVVVAGATFVLGYYFPLLRAYETLSARYQQDRSEAQATQQSLSQAQSALKQEQSERAKLEAQQRASDGSKRLDGERLASLKKALADKLDKTLKSGDAALLAGAGVTLAGRALFVPSKHELSASGKSLLCEIARLAPSEPIRVKAVYAGSGAGTITPWGDPAEAAVAVVQQLQDKCAVASSRLTLAARSAQVAAPDTATGGPAGERVEIEFGRD